MSRAGYNGYGQLGRGDTEDIGDEPDEMGVMLEGVDLGSGELVTDVALGSMFTCAVLESNTVKVRRFSRRFLVSRSRARVGG